MTCQQPFGSMQRNGLLYNTLIALLHHNLSFNIYMLLDVGHRIKRKPKSTLYLIQENTDMSGESQFFLFFHNLITVQINAWDPLSREYFIEIKWFIEINNIGNKSY